MKYEALFGIYHIIVDANSKEEARSSVIKKWQSYKDGGEKKEYIRGKIDKYFPIVAVYFKNGFYREL